MQIPHPRSISRLLVGTDPGHVRLINALAVALAVLTSTVTAWLIVHFLHGDPALVSIGGFLSLQMGFMVKDKTAHARLVTTALLAWAIMASFCVATVLGRWRWAEILTFVTLAGVLTWVRQFGPRATALGTAGFLAYFFALFQHPPLDQLPYFCLVALTSAASALLFRFLLLSNHFPRRRLQRLLDELRGSSAAALTVARTPPAVSRPVPLRTYLRRVDTIATAINDWQADVPTERHIDCTAVDFASLVLDARMELELACLDTSKLLQDAKTATSAAATLAESLDALAAVLARGADPTVVQRLGEQAQQRLTTTITDSPIDLATVGIDRATIAHAKLRAIDLHTPLTTGRAASATTSPSATAFAAPARPTPAPPTPSAPTPPPAPAQPAPRWKPWVQWTPMSRMTVQVVVATAIATGVGELISASRWYWAVTTAFLVFVGANTRGAILTRASRRVAGTLVGVAVGIGLAMLAHGNTAVLIAICVAAVFCALYFGPLEYAVKMFFITITLASMYGLLGHLNADILELRLDETAAGAAVGIACAYLLFSTSTHPTLLAQITAFFDAMDRYLQPVRAALTTGGSGAPVLAAVTDVDSTSTRVRTELDKMVVSLVAHRALNSQLEHLMVVATHTADRLGQAAVGVATEDPAAIAELAPRFDRAVDIVSASSTTARRALVDGEKVDARWDTTVTAEFQGAAITAQSPQATAVHALSQLNWVLLQAIDIREDG